MKKGLTLFFALFLTSFVSIQSQQNEIAIIPQTQLKETVHQLIASAEREILIAQFILINDTSGIDVINHLIQKSNEGVHIRLIVDGVGAYSDTPLKKKHLQEIVSKGIEVKVFHPKWPHIFNITKRLHDKILLVDDQALLGSSSFWDVSFDNWQTETDLLIKGKALTEIKSHFEQVWKSKEVVGIHPRKINTNKYLGIATLYAKNNAPLVFYQTTNLEYWSDGPVKRKGRGSFNKTIHLINQANKKLILINPYFLPSKELKAALINAQKRGVQIELFTNSSEVLTLEYKMLGVAYSKNDSFFKKTNIKVYESTLNFGMIHNKIIAVDGERIYIGSQNLDNLGANHNTENGVCFQSADINQWLHKEMILYKGSFTLAFEDNLQKRPTYKPRGLLKKYWRKTLAFLFKGVL